MDVLTSLGILILSMLIIAFLQFIPGTLSLFSHYAIGKYSKNKAIDLASFFIFGVEIAYFIFMSTTIFIIQNLTLYFDLTASLLAWITSGILLSFSIIMGFLYFRKGTGTRLCFSSHFKNALIHKIKKTKNHSDAFILGVISTLPELIFTIPIYVVSSYQILKISDSPYVSTAIVIAFTFITLTPLLIIHNYFVNDHNLAEVQKSRTKNKAFFRCLISFLYFLLAILIILPRIIAWSPSSTKKNSKKS